MVRRFFIIGLMVATGLLSSVAATMADEAKTAKQPVDYARDIKPLLSSRCYTCHGPDEEAREGELRLDRRPDAIKEAITPGKSDKSELIARLTSSDPDERMPPADSNKKPLTEVEVELVKRWIDQGAKFDLHWAYVSVERQAVPKATDKEWGRGDIDRFVAAGYKQHGVKPSPEAQRRLLIRRLSFDLTGLPPTSAEVAAFVADKSPKAYENLVDRLIASKHYGERMAMMWLDLVRYADTNGIHGDNHREHSPFRDYVIEAFNNNRPFDTFTIEQLAGDLLEKPTSEQRIASGYNRLNMTTREGGAQAKEYRAKYAADRVRNASTVWLGTTMGCCECHDHKYDPFTMRDFYSLAAFFADIQETAVGAQPATRVLNTTQQAQVAQLSGGIAEAQKKANTSTPELVAAQAEWEASLSSDEAKKKAGLPKNIVPVVALEAAKRNDQQKQALAAYYRGNAPLLDATRKQIASLTAEKAAIEKAAPLIVITKSIKPRMMRVLPRGNWLDDSGEEVLPAVPAFLADVSVKDRRSTRLDLARWFVDPNNPLVARVFVNRLWKIAFGRGIVKTTDDYGAQGDVPTHPALLDHLANEFVASGWNVKRVLKSIVMSSTYRQSSFADKGARDRDPANDYLARQGRFRMDAEMVRDNALAVSGLLSRTIGGRSVKPYQPLGYWSHLNFPRRVYKHDAGDSQYRRGLYTYWCRTFLHPSLLAFDAPTREECIAERIRSNTPLQALVLLNDPTYVESARTFAGRIIAEGGDSTTGRLGFAFRESLGREPVPQELAVLSMLLDKHRAQYKADPEAAKKLLGVGLAKTPEGADSVELAAWTSVARVIFNLHETVTRQ